MTELASPPEKNSSDRAYDVTKIVVGAVPVLGGSAQAALELFGPPIGRRRERWLEELWTFVNELANRVGRTVDELVDDERFLSAVVQATSTALGQHVEGKIEMLKAVLEHGVLEPERGDVVTARFLRWVDELDVEHVTVLRYACDPRGWFESHGMPLPQYLNGHRRQVMNDAQLGIDDEDLLGLILTDLSQRGLADSGLLVGMVSGHATLDPWITLRGAEWLRWITLV